jgi:sporulation protein YlmC with PRC-barrel domain
MTSDQRNDLVGLAVVDAHERALGTVRDVLIDEESGVAAWLLVGRRGPYARAVPLARVWLRRGRIVLSARSHDVTDGPPIRLDENVDDRTERRLLAYWDRCPDIALG